MPVHAGDLDNLFIHLLEFHLDLRIEQSTLLFDSAYFFAEKVLQSLALLLNFIDSCLVALLDLRQLRIKSVLHPVLPLIESLLQLHFRCSECLIQSADRGKHGALYLCSERMELFVVHLRLISHLLKLFFRVFRNLVTAVVQDVSVFSVPFEDAFHLGVAIICELLEHVDLFKFELCTVLKRVMSGLVQQKLRINL